MARRAIVMCKKYEWDRNLLRDSSDEKARQSKPVGSKRHHLWCEVRCTGYMFDFVCFSRLVGWNILSTSCFHQVLHVTRFSVKYNRRRSVCFQVTGEGFAMSHLVPMFQPGESAASSTLQLVDTELRSARSFWIPAFCCPFTFSTFHPPFVLLVSPTTNGSPWFSCFRG